MVRDIVSRGRPDHDRCSALVILTEGKNLFRGPQKHQLPEVTNRSSAAAVPAGLEVNGDGLKPVAVPTSAHSGMGAPFVKNPAVDSGTRVHPDTVLRIGS